ncbi:MAG: hypothetical protein NTY36_16960 [Deltaproteobacteria bacterium]|nr:hypothetical protein [Deltaproteobacteria bacterium]
MSKIAKFTKGEYRRNLPHLQADDKTQFVTFTTFKRWQLPESVRSLPVWLYESFDRILRTDESLHQKVEYICQNPVRKGLVTCEDDYPWLWREWVEGAEIP